MAEDALAGKLVTATLSYDGGRGVAAYVPSRPAEAVMFAVDGPEIAHWGALLEATALPPTMIVAAHGAADETADGMRRLHEYSPVFDATRSAAHERFFIDEVRGWARERLVVALPRERTAVLGVSAGGEFTLAMGLRHPQLFGAILCASPGAGYRPPDVLPEALPRAYLVAGTQEPFFRDNATRWARALRDGSSDVVMHERDAGHDRAMWRAELPLMVAWAFVR